jgi:type II secretory ATPase GspE/PulE/Tfp pilus assembly ATPase PilB-like protein
MTISKFPSLKDLGRPAAIMDTFHKTDGPGLIIVSGLTGAGVSTTLASMGAEFQNLGYKVSTIRSQDDELIPGVPEIPYHTITGLTRAVLGVYKPDVVIIDNVDFSSELAKFAIDLARMDALVIVGRHADSAKTAVDRLITSQNEDYTHQIADVLRMSIHQEMVPACHSEFEISHWDAVGKAENLMSMANRERFPFAYRDDRKVQSSVNVYVPTEDWTAPRMDYFLSSRKWKSKEEFLKLLDEFKKE